MSVPQENSTFTLLSLILNSELIRWIAVESVQFWRSIRFHGPYKVTQYDTALELLDKSGRNAVATKRQKVEFLQDGVFAIQDQAWGDGEIFASYDCTPGVAVDRHIESYRWKILISLRSTKNKGDKEEFFITRSIKDGFMTSVEHYQTQIDHPMSNLAISVIFPKTRLPKSVAVVEQNAKRSFPLTNDHRAILSQGRIQYQWIVAKPRLFEAYILKWEW